MANTRIAAAGTFSVAQLAAAVGNIVAFTNGTTAPITCLLYTSDAADE